MPTPDEYKTLITTLPKTPFDIRLTRIVPHMDFVSGMPPSFLYASGRPNRCNPKNVRCIYLSEDSKTARAEWDDLNEDFDQPEITFHGRLKAASIIDLGNKDTFDALELTDEDLTANFRLKVLNIQNLGHAVSQQKDVVAIRYPSRAMSKEGKSGYNLAIFPDSIASPDSLMIYGQKNKVIESWP